MKVAHVVLLVLVGLLFFSLEAVAAEPSLLDPSSYSVGIGGSFEAVTTETGSTTTAGAVNAFVARPLVAFAVVGSATWEPIENVLWFKGGVHRRLNVVGEAFALGLSYDFYALDSVPKHQNEWAANAIWTKPIVKAKDGSSRLLLSASEAWGFDNHEFRTSVQLTLPLRVARASQ